MASDEETYSAIRQVFRGKHETLDPVATRNPFHDLGQISHCDVTVKEVIGLDQDTDATGALIQAARGARAGSKLGQATRGQLFLQGKANLFRAFVGTRPLFVIRTPAVGADKEIALSFRHARRLAVAALAVNHTPWRARAASRTGMPNSNSAIQLLSPNRAESFS
jgi:hypothetical protein